MQLQSLMMGCALVAATAIVTSSVVSQDQEATPPPSNMDWTKLGQPGEHHRQLDFFVGHWKTTAKISIAPGEPPMINTGEAEYKWILDGHYLLGVHTGSMMGQEFSGHDLMGYDNLRGEYTNMWIDNMTTSMMLSRGTLDQASNTLNMRGVYDYMGGKDVPFRTAFRIVSDSETVYESYITQPSGEELLILEVTAERLSPKRTTAGSANQAK